MDFCFSELALQKFKLSMLV